jgi:hypothetical protein
MLKSHEEKRPDFDEQSEIGDQNKERKKPNQMKELNYIPNYPERDLQSLRASSQKNRADSLLNRLNNFLLEKNAFIRSREKLHYRL